MEVLSVVHPFLKVGNNIKILSIPSVLYNNKSMKQKAATGLITQNKETYNAFAKEFSASRDKFWEELSFLAEHAVPDDHVLDIGCGNGRLAPLILERHATYTGVDNSAGLITEAKRLNPHITFMEGDALALPFADDMFDIAYSFAVLHHIPSQELREQFVKEAARVLHPGGTLIVSVWDLWSRKFIDKLILHAFLGIIGVSSLDVGDIMLTFGKKKLPRYLHAFTMKELERLLTKNGFAVTGIDIVEMQSGQRNIVAVCKKK